MKSFNEYLSEETEDKKVLKVNSIAKKYGYSVSFGKFIQKEGHYSFIIEDDKMRNCDDYMITISFNPATRKFGAIVLCNNDSIMNEKVMKSFCDFANATQKMIAELNKVF